MTMPEPTSTPASRPGSAVLADGELELVGRIMPASNATFLAEAVLGEERVRCVYKPVAGERPLWDFPDGTLAARERAAYLVSQALGWQVVPLTLLRDGPHGPGMVQQWCEPDESLDPVDICRRGDVPEGYLRVLDAQDDSGAAVTLVHEDTEPLRRMAVFDVLVNNADRKGGHVLAMTDGHRYGVDHGVSFHVDNKLRTVLWGWASERLRPEERAAVEALLADLEPGGGLRDPLCALLDDEEVQAFVRRCRRLLAKGRMPEPSGSWPAIPWPAF
ncbi:SCO1664 family protein [Nocardioides caldifontis]|uniref:SCO1664 family protein n=1 Tax=Nocardioides caldifontis TaxID=2588938 RepID=UPI001EEF7F20|nr:SCO1664 family protein [Nocardioides caldifontis]